MCGIVGYFGKEPVEDILIKKLKLLEYRGYDSAGIAVKNSTSLKVTKAVGEIYNLKAKVKPLNSAYLGIGHTRWATHGKPITTNAHPHLSTDKCWAVVHNGIIENYEILREDLIDKGHNFLSHTDTEVIAKLLEQTFANLAGDDNQACDCDKYLTALVNTCNALDGSFALGVINKKADCVLFAKNNSPLYVAVNNGEFMMASDPTCFIGFSQSYFALLDGDFGIMTKSGLTFCDKNFNKIEKTPVELNLVYSGDTNDFNHFMLKEIYDSRRVIDNIIELYSKKETLSGFTKETFKRITNIKIIGCGSSYNAAVIGAKMMQERLGIDCSAYVASEFRYSPPTFGKNTMAIFVSQSGETADVLAALNLAKARGALTVSVVNVEHSALSKSTDLTMPIKAGMEIAVASTKAYVGAVVVLYVLALKFDSLIRKTGFDLQQLSTLKDLLQIEKEPEYQPIARLLSKADKLMMLGRGYDYYTALEACIKIVGTSYTSATPYFAGELKHGPLALVSKGTYVIAFATDNDILTKTLANAEETAARGAKLILCTPIELPKEQASRFVHIIKVNKIDGPLQTVLNIIPWQIIAYYMSLYKGNNPDRPRNLAKSVTVE